MLVGCQGEYLLVYNITSQSTIQSIHSLDSYSPGTGLNYTLAGTVIPNGTVIFGGYSDSTHGLASWCCLPPYSMEKRVTYTSSTAAISLKVSSTYTRDIIHDTRSNGLFLCSLGTGIKFLTLNPVSSTTFFSTTDYMAIAIVDFIHCSGPTYGILIAFVVSHRISFLPLTPAASGTPPVSGTLISVAGDGTDGNVDGVGSAARFMNNQGYVAAAHMAPVWIVGGSLSESIRLAVFTNDVPLRLNVTTLIVTPGKQPFGVVMTHDDSILYGADYISGHIITVLNPLSSNPTLGPVLAIVAIGMYKISLHPGCESLLLVGCKGEYLLVYNITSQSTTHSIRALDSAYSGSHWVNSGTVIANGTVIFAGLGTSLNALASWCCLPPYSSSMKDTYTPPVAPAPVAPPLNKTRDIVQDTRSGGLFSTHDGDGLRYLTLNPLTSTKLFCCGSLMLAVVDFIHCSGSIYGLLMAYQAGCKVSFLPLTAGVPPVAGTAIVVAGNETSSNIDGVGSAAQFEELGYIAAAHNAPVWMVGGWTTDSIRRAVFTDGVPLSLNVTTLIATPGKHPVGVVMTNDDSILYASTYNLQQIVTVLNPLSTNPTLGPVLSIVAVNMLKITLHPGCETILLVGCAGDALLIYNVTSQSTIRTLSTGNSATFTFAGTILTNGTVLFGGYSTDPGAFVSWCCLSPYSDLKRSTYSPSVNALPLTVSSKTLRDIIHDTRSGSLFTANNATGIKHLTLSPLSSTLVYTYTGTLFIAMVDFIHCSGPIYGILIAYQDAFKISFLPLTPAAPGGPPVAGSAIDVAGDGTDGNVDGVGSAARLGSLGYVVGAHTAPAWLVAGLSSALLRRVAFGGDIPLQLNVTTIIVTPGILTYGVAVTNDDSILYVSTYNLPQIVTVLNPLSANPTLGPALSIVANEMHKISLHPSCESLLLVGCAGEYLLVYNITSQSTIQSIRALDSYSAGAHYTLAGTVISNGTVVFAGYSSSVDGLASWCCLPPFSSTMNDAYAPAVASLPVAATLNNTRDIVQDTRSGGLFSSHDSDGLRYLTLNPLTSTKLFCCGVMTIAVVDFIHCSGAHLRLTHRVSEWLPIIVPPADGWCPTG